MGDDWAPARGLPKRSRDSSFVPPVFRMTKCPLKWVPRHPYGRADQQWWFDHISWVWFNKMFWAELCSRFMLDKIFWTELWWLSSFVPPLFRMTKCPPKCAPRHRYGRADQQWWLDHISWVWFNKIFWAELCSWVMFNKIFWVELCWLSRFVPPVFRMTKCPPKCVPRHRCGRAVQQWWFDNVSWVALNKKLSWVMYLSYVEHNFLSWVMLNRISWAELWWCDHISWVFFKMFWAELFWIKNPGIPSFIAIIRAVTHISMYITTSQEIRVPSDHVGRAVAQWTRYF